MGDTAVESFLYSVSSSKLNDEESTSWRISSKLLALQESAQCKAVVGTDTLQGRACIERQMKGTNCGSWVYNKFMGQAATKSGKGFWVL